MTTTTLSPREILEQTHSFLMPVVSTVDIGGCTVEVEDVAWTSSNWFDGPSKGEDEDGTWFPDTREEITHACSMGAMVLANDMDLGAAAWCQQQWGEYLAADPDFARAVTLLWTAITEIDPDWVANTVTAERLVDMCYAHDVAHMTIARNIGREWQEAVKVLRELPVALLAKDLVILWNDEENRSAYEVREVFERACKLAVREEELV